MVICSEIIEHLDNNVVVIKYIKKLLKKNGIIIASSPSLNVPLYKLGLLKKFDKEVGHLRRYTKNSLENLFKEANFKIIETKREEGILRNFLFINSLGGFLLRVLNKWPFSEVVIFKDNLIIPMFGESNIFWSHRKNENTFFDRTGVAGETICRHIFCKRIIYNPILA